MDTSHLGEDIVADDGLIGGDGDTTVTLHKARDVVELVFVDVRLGMELILEDHLYTRQRSITTAFAKSIDGDVQPLGTAEDSCQRVGHRQVVVVVGMEVEVGIGITLDHLTEVFDALQGVHDTERVGQHEATDATVAEGIHELIDIEGRVFHAVRPVFEVEIDGESLLTGIVYLTEDILDMGLGRLLQLFLTMAQRAFRQEVDGLAATTPDPIDTLAAVHETEYFDMFEFVDLLRIAADHADGLFLTFGDTGRGHLDAIDIEVVEEHTGDDELLVGQETDTAGLLTVAQGGVHDLHERSQLLVFSYLFCCSHCMVLS